MFCSLVPDAVTISAQELGAHCCFSDKTTSVLHISENTSSAQELGVPLPCPLCLNGNMIPAREAGLNYSVLYMTVSDMVFVLSDVSKQHLLEFVRKPSSTDYLYPYFLVQEYSIGGVVDLVGVNHHNVGVNIVAGVLHLPILLFRILGSVFHVLYLLLKDLCLELYQVLTFFTPCGKWWPQYLYRLNLLVINSCFTLHRSVAEKCRRVKSSLLQNLFRRGEFLVVQASICRVRRFTIIFIVASHLSPMLVSTYARSVVIAPDIGEIRSDNLSWKDIGGGRIPLFNLEELVPHVDCTGKIVTSESSLRFVGHKHKNVAEALYSALGDHVYGRVPLDEFVVKLTQKDVKSIAKIHRVHVPSKFRAENIAGLFKEHSCACCDSYVSVFALHSVKTNSEKAKQWYAGLDASQKKHKRERQRNGQMSAEQKQKKAEHMRVKRVAECSKVPDFPPLPPSKHLQETITVNWCEDTSPDNFIEGGCAVFGRLVPLSQLFGLSDSGCDLDVLVREGMGVTCLERSSVSDLI